MTIHLSNARTRELLHAAVADRGPDYVDPRAAAMIGCKYLPSTMLTYDGDGFIIDGTPIPTNSCIAGHVLLAAGVPADELREFDDENAPVESVLGYLELRGVLDADGTVHHVLRAAQRLQDDGGTWGDAVASAERVADGRSF